jgi:hypothetical protein
VSSAAPSRIQRAISSICAAASGGCSFGISTLSLPSLSLVGVIILTRLLASGLPGAMAVSPLSPPLMSAANGVIT